MRISHVLTGICAKCLTGRRSPARGGHASKAIHRCSTRPVQRLVGQPDQRVHDFQLTGTFAGHPEMPVNSAE
jgi:hypothetical protein